MDFTCNKLWRQEKSAAEIRPVFFDTTPSPSKYPTVKGNRDGLTLASAVGKNSTAVRVVIGDSLTAIAGTK